MDEHIVENILYQQSHVPQQAAMALPGHCA
jgi:hypothetical protein